jgi:hypothetical protein
MKQAISGAMADRKRTMKIGVQNSTKKPPKSMLSKTITKGAQNRLQGESGRCLALVREAAYRVDGPSPAGFTKRPLQTKRVQDKQLKSGVQCSSKITLKNESQRPETLKYR